MSHFSSFFYAIFVYYANQSGFFRLLAFNIDTYVSFHFQLMVRLGALRQRTSTIFKLMSILLLDEASFDTGNFENEEFYSQLHFPVPN